MCRSRALGMKREKPYGNTQRSSTQKNDLLTFTHFLQASFSRYHANITTISSRTLIKTHVLFYSSTLDFA